MVAYKDELNSLKIIAEPNPVAMDAFKAIRKSVEKIREGEVRQKINCAIDLMEESFNTKNFLDSYVTFMDLSKHHLSKIENSLPKITALLTL